MSTIRITKAVELAAAAALIAVSPISLAGQSSGALPNFLKATPNPHAHAHTTTHRAGHSGTHQANSNSSGNKVPHQSAGHARAARTSPASQPSIPEMEQRVSQAQHAAHSGGASFADIVRLNNQEGLLKLRLKVMQLQSKIAALNGSSAIAAAGGGGGGGGSGSLSSLPKVKVIYGTPHHLTALLVYGDGGTIPVHKGTRLPGGGHVSSITDQSVTLRVSGHSFPLLIQGAGINSITIPTASDLSFTPPGSAKHGGGSHKQ